MEAEPRPPPAIPTATEVILAVVLGGLAAASIWLCNALVWKPRRLRSRLQKQGVEGPPPTLFVGNIPDMKRFQKEVAAATAQWNPPSSSSLSDKDHSLCHAWPSTIFPFMDHWRNQYGPMFMYSMGSIQLLCVLDVEVVKELSLCTSLSLGKPSYLSKDRGPLLGEGILSSSGSIWAHHRKIIAPELYLDKVKGMVNLMVDSTNLLLKSWERRVQSEGDGVEISIDDDLRSLSADIISRTCFGSNYTQGEEIFLKLRKLQKVMSKGNIGVPGSRYLPTKDNIEIWKLEKAIRDMILEVVMQRQEQGSCEEDLLQMLLEAAKDGGGGGGNEGLPPNMSRDKFIVDNCKNIYFAGHETTAVTALWALMLLAAYPEWQDRAREEVVGVVGDDDEGVLDYDKLRSMKMLNMIIQETLRLYPPAAFVVRSALEEIKFKKMVVPKGFDIQVPISMLHLDPDIWGADASKFNPERFSQGISGASNSIHAYLPFGLGPRVCAGQHFAMVELKVILSLILSKFSFSLSPKYKHAPSFRLVIEPGSGVQLCVTKL